MIGRALLLLMVLHTASRAEPGVLEVTVTGVRSARGEVLVAICDRASFLQDDCAYRGRAPAQPGAVLVRLTRIPPGIYAAQAYQDENANGRIDRTILGIPSEGIGFSRDAPMRFGPPRFEDAAFTLGQGGAITIALHYYD